MVQYTTNMAGGMDFDMCKWNIFNMTPGAHQVHDTQIQRL